MYPDASLLVTAGRLLILFFFLVIGLTNLTKEQIKVGIDRMAELHTPFPLAAFWVGNALQFGGCALLLTGWHAEIGVYCLIFVTVTATAIFHRFWTMPDPFRRAVSRRMLLHNVGIVGGLLLLLEAVK